MTEAAENYALDAFLTEYQGVRAIHGTPGAIDYRALSIDSRTIATGELFVAISGENHDAHAFVPDVLGKSAAAIVVSETWFQNQNLPGANIVVVEDTLDFLQQLAAWHRRRFRIPLIGITGSNGKTTTRAMITALLEKRYRLLATAGNKNNHIGLPLTLLRLRKEHQMAIVEMGTNHPGEISMLAALARPTAAVVTNVGKGHFGYFGNLMSVYREKTALFEAVKPNGALFINDEDPLLRDYQRRDCRPVRVGLTEDCDVFGKIIGTDQDGCIQLRLDSLIDIQLAVPGNHQLMNALLAVAVARFAGLTDGEIRDRLEAFQPAEQRMQISEVNGVRIINDAYNANPDSMQAAIDFLSNISSGNGRKWIALGDMLELGEFASEEHRQIGRYLAAKNFDGVFLFGQFSRETQEILQAETGNTANVHWYPSHEQIAEHLGRLMRSGDTLLLKGSRGMQMELVLRYLQKSG